MPRLVITGANRGIGLCLAQRYASDGWEVHATAREPDAADRLSALPNTKVYRLDVSRQDSIEAFAAALGGLPIDHLINNAGIFGPHNPDFGRTEATDWVSVLTVNAASPWLVTERLAENVKAGAAKRVGVITSQLGSITNAALGWPAIYAVSKAAANMTARQLSLILGEAGVVTLALHPGWVRTDMGGEAADISPEESAEGLFEIMTTATTEMNGGFFSYDGQPLPW
ncbi:MAG: SDR family oxidoreductase [Rhodospirillales bacterium]